MSASDREWLSVSEVARRLGVDRHAVYRAVDRGEVPHRRMGRGVRIPASWLDVGPDVEHSAPDAEAIAAAVMRQLAALLASASAREPAPGSAPGTELLDPNARDDVGGRRGA